jgi:DNA-binding CsgD family transcriptional regulator
VIAGQTYRDVTSRIFAAAIEPSHWQDALDAVADLIPGAKLHLFAHDIEERRNLGLFGSGHDPEFIRSYIDYYAALNPYPAFADQFSKVEVRTLESSIPYSDLAHTEYFQDWIRPQEDLRTGTGMVLSNEPASLCVVGTLQPWRHAEVLDPLAMEVMTDLAPVFQQAWRLCGSTAARAFDTGAVVSGISGEIVLALNANRRIAHLNGAGETALVEGRWLTADHAGRVHLTNAEADRRLGLLLARIGGDERLEASQFVLRDRNGAADVDLLPLSPDAIGDWTAALRLGLLRPAVMLCLTPRRVKSGLPAWAGRAGLSPMETGVVRALSSGLSAREIAERRDVSIHTIRNQIKSAMAKCGVSRQSQLVALVLRNE